MSKPWEPKWWKSLEPDVVEGNTSEFGWLLRVLETVTHDVSRLEKAKLNPLLGWVSDAERRKRVLAVLHAAEVCQRQGDADLTSICVILKAVLSKKSALEEDDLRRLLILLVTIDPFEIAVLPCAETVTAFERSLIANTPSDDLRELVAKLGGRIAGNTAKPSKSTQKLLERVERLADDSPLSQLHLDDGWADMLKQQVTNAPPEQRSRWEMLLRHAANALPESPATGWEVTVQEVESQTGINVLADEFSEAFDASILDRCVAAAWQHESGRLIEEIDPSLFYERMTCWLLEVPRSKPGYLVRQSMNREMLRGLLWCCAGQNQPDLTRVIRMATEFFYAKNSPLAVAGLQVLIRLRSKGLLDELARIAASIKAASQKRLLQSARRRIAAHLGVSVEELDDPILPTMELQEVGLRRESYSGYTVELRVAGPQSVVLQWFKPDGSPQKTLPTKVKRNHAREVAALKDSVKGIRQTLSLASAQVESSLLTVHTWQQSAWRQRYLDHPVAGTIGRRLIWSFTDGEQTQDAIFQDGGFVDCRGRKVEVQEKAKVSLWHPINAAPETVLCWREFLFEQQVTQPFKQAHREVYLLTDAERETRTYSNRFAAHVLRQPQFRALAKARGWMSPYFGQWDGGSEGVPDKELKKWDMRAEFWVDAASDAFAEAGGILYLTTDQVRFFQPRDAREPIPLADVPPLVFTEIMRDVDLFVGVGSTLR